MNSEDFSEREWQDIFDEFRWLVVRAGYSDWDASAMDALADERDEGELVRRDRTGATPAVEQLRQYTTAFMRFLKARSRYASGPRLDQLGALLRTEDGSPVQDFMVDFEGRDRRIFEGDDNPDAMIETLARFLAELNGEDGAFWNGDDEAGA